METSQFNSKHSRIKDPIYNPRGCFHVGYNEAQFRGVGGRKEHASYG